MSGPSKQLVKLEKAIQAGSLDHFPELLTETFLLRLKSGPDEHNGFHLAARYGQLKALPAKLMTKHNLCLRDCHGRTSYHIAARYGNLLQIPDEVNDVDLLEDGFGRNILHCAFLGQFGDVKLIPPPYLTPFCFAAEDDYSETPVHYAARTGRLEQLIKNERYIKFTDLFKENDLKVSPFAVAAEYGQLDPIPLPQDWKDHLLLIKRHVQAGKKLAQNDEEIGQKADIWLASCGQKFLASKARV